MDYSPLIDAITVSPIILGIMAGGAALVVIQLTIMGVRKVQSILWWSAAERNQREWRDTW